MILTSQKQPNATRICDPVWHLSCKINKLGAFKQLVFYCFWKDVNNIWPVESMLVVCAILSQYILRFLWLVLTTRVRQCSYSSFNMIVVIKFICMISTFSQTGSHIWAKRWSFCYYHYLSFTWKVMYLVTVQPSLH